MSNEKGVDVLLDAAAELPAIPFRLAGEGPLLELYRRQVRDRGLSHVTLLGKLSHDAMMREMMTWRIAVVPSRSIENCPLGVLEPFSLGIPVIGTDLGGTRELLEGRGILVAPNDSDALRGATDKLWNDVERCRELGLAGRAFAIAECGRSEYAERLIGLLEPLVQSTAV